MAKAKLRARVDSNQRKQVAQHQIARQQRRQVRAPVMSVKNIEGRVRNRRFKIKRMSAQPKNAEVKKNGRLVRKMTVRRSTVYLLNSEELTTNFFAKSLSKYKMFI